MLDEMLDETCCKKIMENDTGKWINDTGKILKEKNASWKMLYGECCMKNGTFKWLSKITSRTEFGQLMRSRLNLYSILIIIFLLVVLYLYYYCSSASYTSVTHLFQTLPYLSFGQKRHLHMISTCVWRTDRRTDGRADWRTNGHALL